VIEPLDRRLDDVRRRRLATRETDSPMVVVNDHGQLVLSARQ